MHKKGRIYLNSGEEVTAATSDNEQTTSTVKGMKWWEQETNGGDGRQLRQSEGRRESLEGGFTGGSDGKWDEWWQQRDERQGDGDGGGKDRRRIDLRLSPMPYKR